MADHRLIGHSRLLEVGGFWFSQPLIARVNAWRQALRVGDSVQQFGQFAAFVDAECREERVLVLPRYLTDSFEDFAAILCQMEGVQAAVLGVWLPLNEFSLLQIVQDGYQPAGVDSQPRGQFLLADARGVAQESQDSRVRRREVEGT
jgi:hypothetical protein